MSDLIDNQSELIQQLNSEQRIASVSPSRLAAIFRQQLDIESDAADAIEAAKADILAVKKAIIDHRDTLLRLEAKDRLFASSMESSNESLNSLQGTIESASKAIEDLGTRVNSLEQYRNTFISTCNSLQKKTDYMHPFINIKFDAGFNVTDHEDDDITRFVNQEQLSSLLIGQVIAGARSLMVPVILEKQGEIITTVPVALTLVDENFEQSGNVNAYACQTFDIDRWPLKLTIILDGESGQISAYLESLKEMV